MVMFGNLNLDIAPGNVIWPIIISGFGIPSIFVPMTTFSVPTVGKAEIADATGITSLVRNLGGSVGVSLITTFVTRGTQAHQALLVSHLVPHNHIYLDRLNQMETIVAPHSGAITAQSQAYGLLYETLQQQAALWSYIDQFRLLAIVCLLLAPIIFLYRKSRSIAK
jgi:MFS transporter, DHA2 family, multidrug resistance protein